MRFYQALNPLEINQLELNNCARLTEGETSGQDNQELKPPLLFLASGVLRLLYTRAASTQQMTVIRLIKEDYLLHSVNSASLAPETKTGVHYTHRWRIPLCHIITP